jgi:hypothetical protein
MVNEGQYIELLRKATDGECDEERNNQFLKSVPLSKNCSKSVTVKLLCLDQQYQYINDTDEPC